MCQPLRHEDAKKLEFENLKRKIHTKLVDKLDLSKIGDLEGEVLRRESAGEWAEDQSAPRGVTLGEAWRPHERVRKRLLEGAEHGLVEYADEVLG